MTVDRGKYIGDDAKVKAYEKRVEKRKEALLAAELIAQLQGAKLCSVEGCKRPVWSKTTEGMCLGHYAL